MEYSPNQFGETDTCILEKLIDLFVMNSLLLL